MNRTILALILCATSGGALAAAGGIPLQHVYTDVDNRASLQRGARMFVNYCMGCHSLQYMRYSRLAEDLALTEEQVEQYLIFDPDAKIGDLMTNAMPETQATQWFGAAPPDLTLVARSRGPDWIYTFLKSFYADPSRPTGWNNLTFPNASMPHVLWELQGIPVAADVDEAHVGHASAIPTEIVREGSMSAEEYDAAVTDLVTFLEYAGEPAILQRTALGWKVLLFLVVFAFLAYLLKREYWRDIHGH